MEIPICFFFFILKLFRSQLIEIIDRMNIGVYEKTEQKHPFCSCSGIWESSHQTVYVVDFVSLALGTGKSPVHCAL